MVEVLRLMKNLNSRQDMTILDMIVIGTAVWAPGAAVFDNNGPIDAAVGCVGMD